MKTIVIDGKMMGSKEEAHTYLPGRLSFPEYYGRNLDALHDCLNGINEPIHIVVYHLEDLISSTGDYGAYMLMVLEHAGTENSMLTLSYDAGSDPSVLLQYQ